MRGKGIALFFSSVAVACSMLIIISAHLLDDWAKAGFDFPEKATAAVQDEQLDMGMYLANWQAELSHNGFTEEQVEKGKEIVKKHLGETDLTSLAGVDGN
ncbi:hypothetical protein [Sporosarcina cyprini]|uniref:hypothetical protein n=1 Tax=Sporosarcina cyprini TaxID=2910523 RepID=UPI001EE0DD05|nr:hypothetical protein [Sporosarcina cyprini]MCG3087976.1 hypothetical protein [Sporosarcina cyprini]